MQALLQADAWAKGSVQLLILNAEEQIPYFSFILKLPAGGVQDS